MPGESLFQAAEGVGKKFHTWQRAVGANNVEDEFMLPGEYPYATYTALISAVSLATSADHVLEVMAGSSLNVRVRRIHIEQNASATAANLARFQVLRLTSAGTGGTAITPGKYDTGDAAAGATAMTLPSAKGTESTALLNYVLDLRQGFSTASAQMGDTIDWVQAPNAKPLIIPAGTSNGITIKIITGNAGATVDGWVEFVETSFI